MPVNPYGGSPTQTGYPMVPGGAPNPAMPTMNFNLPGVGSPSAAGMNLQDAGGAIKGLLSQAPQSLSQLMGPLLAQVYGGQQNMMAPLFAQQGEQGAAAAQSDAMKRGLTGSSIESTGMGQARQGASQAFMQYMAQQLNQLVPAYMGAAQFDIGQNVDFYRQLAQALGQEDAQSLQLRMSREGYDAASAQAQSLGKAQMWSGVFQGIGSLGNGLLAGRK